MEKILQNILELLNGLGLNNDVIDKCMKYLGDGKSEKEVLSSIPEVNIQYPLDKKSEEIYKALESIGDSIMTARYLQVVVEISKVPSCRIFYWFAGYGTENVYNMLAKYRVTQKYHLRYLIENCVRNGFKIYSDTMRYFELIYDKEAELFHDAYAACDVNGKVLTAAYLVMKNPRIYKKLQHWLEDVMINSIPNLFQNCKLSSDTVEKITSFLKHSPGVKSDDTEIVRLSAGINSSLIDKTIQKIMLGAGYLIHGSSDVARQVIRLSILLDCNSAYDELREFHSSILLYEKSQTAQFPDLYQLTGILKLPMERIIAWMAGRTATMMSDFNKTLLEEMQSYLVRYQRAITESDGIARIYLCHLLWERGKGREFTQACEALYEEALYKMFHTLGADRDTVVSYMAYVNGEKAFGDVEVLAKSVPIRRISSGDLFKGLVWMIEASEQPKRILRLCAGNNDVGFFNELCRFYMRALSAPLMDFIKLMEVSGIGMDIILPFLGHCLQDGGNPKYKEAFPELEAYIRKHAEEISKLLHLCRNDIRENILEIIFDENKKKFLPVVMECLNDSAKSVRTKAVSLLGEYPDAFDVVSSLLDNKKQAVRENAVLVLGAWKDERSLKKLAQFYETEKNDKIRNLISGILKTVPSAAVPTEIGVDTDIAEYSENALKSVKLASLSWIFDNDVPKVRYKGEERYCNESIVKYIIVSYSIVNAISLNYEARKISDRLDERDLADVALHILNLWLDSGAEAKKKWVLPLVALHGDDRVILLLKKKIEEWPEHARGAIACDAVTSLALNGSNLALMIVDNISRKFKFRQVKEAAAKAFGIAAKELGVDPEFLSDRIVPNLGLDQRGEKLFDYGSRKFTVVLNGQHELEVFDESQKKLKALPAPNANEDAEKAQIAADELKRMKKQLKSIIDVQKVRLETALSLNRLWSSEAWKELFVVNPIMHQFAFKLIWGVYGEDGQLQETFRYMEDGTFNTKDEAEMLLPEGGFIGLVHPLDLTESELSLWENQLSDYEVVQPFEQINRQVFRVTDVEREARTVERFGGIIINGLSLLGRLTKLGWYRGSVRDAGCYESFYKENIKLGIGAELHFSGVSVGCENEDVTIYHIVFYKAGTVERGSYVYDEVKDDNLVSPIEVPPRMFSEIVYDVFRAVAGSKEVDKDWKNKR